MENVSATATPDEFIDIASLRILDLRMLQQDEIRCLAQICGDVPARLQDLVDVMVDKSIFNESAGSRRQTYDRDRLPRNKQRHFLSNLSSAQLRYAVESAGRSHKDLLIHLCRQLKISEKGDRALYQPQAVQPSGVVVEGNRSMSLKRMARASASLAGRADGAMAVPSKAAAEVLVNGKEMATQVLHQPTKKMKTKEEARRRAAESQTGTASPHQPDKQAPRAVRVPWLGHGESVQSIDLSSGGMRKIQHDVQSPRAGRVETIGHSVEVSEPFNYTSRFVMERPSEGTQIVCICSTCERSFANVYSLRRHTITTGHTFDSKLIRSGVGRKKKVIVKEKALRCSCGNTYATPFTLRRHAITNGHSFKLASTALETTPTVVHQQQIKKDEEKVVIMGPKPERQKPGAHLSERAWKSNTRRFKCRQCYRQFVRKKHYIRHMGTHYQKKKKKTGKYGRKLLRTQVGELSSKIKVRLGKKSKLQQGVAISQEAGSKRKHEPEPVSKRVKAYKTVDTSQQMPGYTLLGKPQSLPCQECGKIFDEFSRYTGHLGMHARLRKMLVKEGSSPTSAVLKKNLMDLRSLSSSGFRTLLYDRNGTYLRGLPAKLLFSGSALTDREKGKV